MTDFDPLAVAAQCRAGLYLTLDDAVDLDAAGRGRAAAVALNAIVAGWIVGEAATMAPRLEKAARWLVQSDAQLGDTDPEGAFGVQRRRRALGTAQWLRGEDARPAFAGAARAGVLHLATATQIAPWEPADHLCDLLLAGDAADARAAFEALTLAPDSRAGPLTLALATDGPADDPTIATALAGALSTALDEGDPVRAAIWCHLAFAAAAGVANPEGALLMAWAYLPHLPVPPALAARGWTDGDAPMVVALPPGTPFVNVERLASFAGLARDTDAVPQEMTPPVLASWTGPHPAAREIDWHNVDGARWLDVRGEATGSFAGALAACLGGRIATDPATSLAGMLEVPRGDANLSDSGTLRWTALRAAIAAAIPETAVLVSSLIEAGLADPDWRVRMTAILGTGRLRLARLADAAMAAAVPPAGADGLEQEDRRMLLALRQAAADRARGAAPWGQSDDPEVAAKRRAHQTRLHARLETLPVSPEDRTDALLLALLGGPAALGDNALGCWRPWLEHALGR